MSAHTASLSNAELSRAGGTGWDVRYLDWRRGGRFVPVGEVE